MNSGMPMLMEVAEVEQAEEAGQGDTHQQRGEHRIARRQALGDEVADEHRHHQRRLLLRGVADLDADAEQHAGQQGRGQRPRHLTHQPVEAASDAADRDQRGADDECTDGLAIRHTRQAADQQRGTGGGPGDDDGRAVAQGQTDGGQGHADGQRPDPRGNLRGAQPRGLAGLEHQHQRAGVAGEHGDEPGDDGGGGGVGQRAQGRGGGSAVSHARTSIRCG